MYLIFYLITISPSHNLLDLDCLAKKVFGYAKVMCGWHPSFIWQTTSYSHVALANFMCASVISNLEILIKCFMSKFPLHLVSIPS